MKTFRNFRLYALALLLLFTMQGFTCHPEGSHKNSNAAAQPPSKGYYAQREKNASPEIKARLDAIRKKIKDENLSFSVGYTTAMDVPLNVLAATKLPDNIAELRVRQNKLANELSAIETSVSREFFNLNPDIRRFIATKCSADANSFDWRKAGKVTPVKSQQCGDCWNFTALGAFEGSYAVRNNELIDASEQYTLNCSGGGDCGGGWWDKVFDTLISTGTGTEASMPYQGSVTACPDDHDTLYRAVKWGYVETGDATIPPVANIKAALCEHGPLATAVLATPAFQAYTGVSPNDVFDEQDTTHGINHGVVIVGWSDKKKAWLIKNSWGTGWGNTAGTGLQAGYMWIAYDSNNVGIGTAWVDAKSKFYILPRLFRERLELERIIVKPFPEPNPNPFRPRQPDSIQPARPE